MKLDDDDKFNLKVLGALVIIGLMVILFARYCHADERNYLSVGLGRTTFQKPTDGVWWQSGYGHDFANRSQAMLLDIGWRVNRYVSVGLEFTDYGSSSLYASWISDQGHQKKNHGNETTVYGRSITELKSVGLNMELAYPTRTVTPYLSVGYDRHYWKFRVDYSDDSNPRSTNTNSLYCRHRGYAPTFRIGVRRESLGFEYRTTRISTARASDGCTASIGGDVSAVFITYRMAL